MDEHTVYYKTAEAAKILRISEATLRRWVHSNPPRIGADRTVSGQYRFTEAHIEAARPRPVEHRATGA